MVVAKMPPLDGQIWKLVAYLGRYGHQPADVTLALPVTDLRRLSDGVSALVEEEAAAVSGHED